MILLSIQTYRIKASKSQRKENDEHPEFYLTREFTEPENIFDIAEKDNARIIFAIKKLLKTLP